MKISSIFVVIQESLYSVQFEGSTLDELADIFDKWSDVEYLHDFFTQHIKDLQNGFYDDQYGMLSVENAVEITLNEALDLEEELLSLAKQGKEAGPNLQRIFKPLDNNDYKQQSLQKNKATGANRKSWLRIYAIRIGPNTFVICGGGIKLTPTMNEVAHLRLALSKLDITKNHLKEIGVLDEDDYELLEI